MNEKTIQNQIQIALSQIPGVTNWRNNTGSAWTGNKTARLKNGALLIYEPRPVKFGLCPGSSDLIGLKSVTITPDMVGQTVAIFAAVEVKTKTGRATDKQNNFLKHINQAGGIGIVARSPDDLDQLK